MRVCILLLIFSLLFVGSLSVNGVDIANPYAASVFTCLKNAGNTYAIIRAFRSSGILDGNAVSNLKNAKAAGFTTTDIYIFPCRGKSGSTQVDEVIAGIPGDLYSTIWVDVETNPSPGCSWSGHDSASNCAFLTEVVNRIKAKGKKVGIYGSSSMWQGIFGSTGACPGVGSEPLWYAHYDNLQSFSDFKSFGGWTKPAIKQYAGDVTQCNADIDKNWHP